MSFWILAWYNLTKSESFENQHYPTVHIQLYLEKLMVTEPIKNIVQLRMSSKTESAKNPLSPPESEVKIRVVRSGNFISVLKNTISVELRINQDQFFSQIFLLNFCHLFSF